MGFNEHFTNVDPFYFDAKPVVKTLPKSVWETYSAFANTFGGTIVLGVSKKRVTGEYVVTGLDNPEKLVRDFWNIVKNEDRVSSDILKNEDVKIEVLDGKSIIEINVPRADRHFCPIYIDNSVYSGTFRRGNEGDRHCTTFEVTEMIRDSKDDIIDLEVVESMRLDVFNKSTVDIYRAHLKAQTSNHPWVDLPYEKFLSVIGAAVLRTNGIYNPTKAGLLMFGNEYSIVKVFPSFCLEYYEGDIENGEISDKLLSSSGEWSGNIFDYYLLIADRMMSGPKELVISRGKVGNSEINVAMDHVLLNALVNSDYSGKGGVVIEKTKDSVRISEAGLLRTPLERLKTKGNKEPRNKAVARMLNLIGLMDGNERFLIDLLRAWKKNGFPEPVIEEKIDPPQTNILMMLDYPSIVISSERGMSAQILRFIKEDNRITAAKISSKLGMSKRHVERGLAELKKKGKIERVGNGRSGYWIIV